MRTLTLLFFLSAAFSNAFAQTPTVEIYYFHRTQRCPTCLSIEENTKKVLSTYFSNEVKNKKIKFTSVNIEDKANKALVDKYKAAGSALFITKIVNGKETTLDITSFAFSYSRNDPDEFMTGLKNRITANLK